MFNQAQEMLSQFENFLIEYKEFDTVINCHFDIYQTEVTFWCRPEDNFATSSDHYNGALKSFNANKIENLWVELNRIPSRPERELRFMLSRCGDAAEAEVKFRSQAAKEFAKELIEKRAVYANLLEDLK